MLINTIFCANRSASVVYIIEHFSSSGMRSSLESELLRPTVGIFQFPVFDTSGKNLRICNTLHLL